MQLNFLQEDLLAAMQKGKPIVPILANPNKNNLITKPVQISLLADEPAPAPVKKPKSERTAPVMEASPVYSEKAEGAFKTISEAAEILGVPTHVLRFWESQFPQIHPTKSRGGRRYYRPEDMDVLITIKNLLYKQGYTIKGAKKAFSQMRVEMDTQPVAIEKPSKPLISDKQKAQLSAIRQELLGFKNILSPYLA